MDLNKYSYLRGKIHNQTFETKNKDVDKWLFIFSYFGNLGSIFFAFFLVYPALLKAIAANITGGTISVFLSGFMTVLILAGFELLKRKVFGNFVFDLVKSKFKMTKSIVGWMVFSFCFVATSFYFSLTGAIDFAKTSGEKNQIVKNTVDNRIDSITSVYNERKLELLEDNKQYRESNAQYRENIANSPINFRTVRLEYQQMIDANQKAIDENEKRIKTIDYELSVEIQKLKQLQQEESMRNEIEDVSNIYLFLIISTSIEFIIIIGVYFRTYYEYNVFVGSMNQMENMFKKRDRYKTLIRFIYKEGTIGSDESIMGKTTLVALISERTKMPNPSKFVDDFLNDMEYLGIIKLVGKRRYTATSFQDALSKIDKFDDTLRLLENLN